METSLLYPGMDLNPIELSESAVPPELPGDPRIREPDRRQVLLVPCSLEELLPVDHEARRLWAAVERLDLSEFYTLIRARGEEPGRPMTDPRLLVALWLYATKSGVGSGRELERLCQEHDAYRWLCGGVHVNYHTLNDFRVGYEAPLDALFTQVLTVLVKEGLVTVERISQDGTRMRAGAGMSSFRRRGTLERLRQEIREHIEVLKKELEADPQALTARRRAAQERAARQESDRVEAALKELEQIEAAKSRQKDKPSKDRPARASTTDAQARIMKMPGGGHAAGYNWQFAEDTQSRAVVGVEVTNAGSDVHESEPMREQVEQRTGRKVREHLIDGGYVGLESIERAEAAGVTMYAPVPEPRKKDVDRYQPRPGDGPGVAAWRQRMGTSVAQEIYKERASNAETVNAEVKGRYKVRSVMVRGLRKVRCMALWCGFTFNVMHFMDVLLG